MNTQIKSKSTTSNNIEVIQDEHLTAEDIKNDQSQHPLAQKSQPYDWSSILQITS